MVGGVRVERWERRAEWPLTGLAVLFLGAYAWPILSAGLSEFWLAVCRGVGWVAWLLFVVDYGARFLLSSSRSRFVAGNLPDLAVIVLPLLRPLRLLRLVTMLSVLNRYAGATLRGRVVVYVVGSTGLVVFLAALAELDAERDAAGATITSFDDALWWAVTTVTTVGYGDNYPVTATGRLIAGGLMLAGIALLGVVTASLASWLVQRVAEVEEESDAATRRDIAALHAELTALRRELADPARRREVGAGEDRRRDGAT